MSLALYKPSRIVKVSDPRLDLDENGIQIISDSATNLVYQQYTSNNVGGAGANIIQFNTTQTPTQAVSTKMFIEVTFEVTLTATQAAIGGEDTRLYCVGYDAPRFFPLHSVATHAQISINGAANDIYPNQIIDALMRYNNELSELSHDLSTTPSYMDTFLTYNDPYVLAVANVPGFGTGANPLAAIGESGGIYQARGGFPFVSEPVFSDVGTNRQCKLSFTIYEPVIISPAVFGHTSHKSLYGVKNLNLTYNLGDLSRVWSRNLTRPSGGDIPTSISVNIINGSAKLHLITMNPKITDNIMPVQIYPWNQIQMVNKDLGTYTPNQTKEETFSAQQLSGVPKRIYIYAKKSVKTPFDTDTFARINSISMQFDNTAGIFAGAPAQQLYQICAENGLSDSYANFRKYVGSVFCADLSTNIPLAEYLAVGSSKSINLQFTINLTNMYAGNTDFTLYCAIVYEGVFSIDQFGTALFQLNTLSVEDVLNSKNIQKLPYNAVSNFATGGSFGSKLSSLGSFAKKLGKKAIGAYEGLSDSNKAAIANLATDAATFVSPALGKAIQDFGPAAYDRAKALIGMGYSENQIYALLEGAGMKKKKGKGAKKSMSGGKKLSREELLRIARS